MNSAISLRSCTLLHQICGVGVGGEEIISGAACQSNMLETLSAARNVPLCGHNPAKAGQLADVIDGKGTCAAASEYTAETVPLTLVVW